MNPETLDVLHWAYQRMLAKRVKQQSKPELRLINGGKK